MTRQRARVERSAGGVVLRRIRGEVHVLLIRDPYQNWGLPKGHVEPGEDDVGAARREVREETGLERLVLGPPVKTIDWFFQLRGRRIHKYCAFFLMGSDRGKAIPEQSEGISDCRWVPLAEARETISYANAREVLEEARRMLQEGVVDQLLIRSSDA